MKPFLIKLLGGVSSEKFKQLELENSALSQQVAALTPYKEFTASISRYVGSYPAWKAQSEYRAGLFNLGFPLGVKHLQNDEKHVPSHLEYVDLYLGQIVDSFSTLLEKVEVSAVGDPSEFWHSKEELDLARGEQWLVSQMKKEG